MVVPTRPADAKWADTNHSDLNLLMAGTSTRRKGFVGVPPKAVVDQLHSAGIMVMNMVGSAKHVPKALAVGVDAICAQGTEAGGHTGDIATMPLIPQCVDACRGKTSPLHGGPIAVVGAGGIFDGRGLAAALSLGAEAVWVGTRFVASTEATAGPRHKNFIVKTNSDETVRTLIFSGRPMRVFKSNYIQDWQSKRPLERDELLKSGKRPYKTDLVANDEKGTPLDFIETYPMIYGQSCGGIDEILPAKDIVLNMVNEATKIILNNTSLLKCQRCSIIYFLQIIFSKILCVILSTLKIIH